MHCVPHGAHAGLRARARSSRARDVCPAWIDCGSERRGKAHKKLKLSHGHTHTQDPQATNACGRQPAGETRAVEGQQKQEERERGSQASRQTDKAAKKDRNRGPERTGKRKDRKRPEDGPEEDRKQKPGKDRNRFPDPGPEDRNRTGRGKTAGPEEDRNNCI
jgi:hypothetical protein